MKNYFLKLAVIALPILVVLFAELFLLPPDYFTFRVWEALLVQKHNSVLTGPFYPRQRLHKIEEGDLAAHTDFAVKKDVEWVTDQYGYRNDDNSNQTNDIVIIGDSNAVGSTLTQSDMLSEVLERATGKKVYTLAPATIDTFFQSPRFVNHLPQVVVLECTERGISILPPVRQTDFSRQQEQDNLSIVQQLAILEDRLLYKKNMFRYYEARLLAHMPGYQDPVPKVWANDKSMVFLQENVEAKTVSPEQFDHIVSVMKGYQEALSKHGVRLIILPVPNKETIYYDRVPGITRPLFLDELNTRLQQAGIVSVDTSTDFMRAKENQPEQLLYNTDDTHWSALGVQIAASLLVKSLNTGFGELH